VNAQKWIFRLLFYVAIDAACLFIFSGDGFSSNFNQGFLILSLLFLTTVALERFMSGHEFYFQLPFGNILFCAIAFYIPLPFIYNSLLLKTLSAWPDDATILKTLLYTNIGLHCVLLGYYFVRIFSPLKSSASYIIKNNRLNLLFALYFISVILLIYTGNYGITEQSEESAFTYVTILTSISQFGIFGLTALVYYYPTEKTKISVVTLLFCLTGLLSGFKENAILPLVVVGVTFFFISKKIPLKIVLAGSVASVIIFSVVTSFRNAYIAGGRKELSSIQDLTSTYVKSAQEGTKSKYNHFKLSNAEGIIHRLNYASAFGKVIRYAEKKDFGLPPNSHPIHILGTPFYFLLPRIIIPFKPLADFGNFVTTKVYGYKGARYSIGVSQTGYSYLWKGLPGILLLMTFVGVFQGLLYRLFYMALPPLYIYLFISNIYVSDAIWVYTVSFFRFSFLFFLVFLLMGTKVTRSALSPNQSS
jgi:hypothetical protein